MIRFILSCGLLLGLVTLAAPTHAQFSPETIARCKKATALVDAGEYMGSAFCVDAAGLFVTNEHVIEDVGPGVDLQLVLNSGEKDERTVPATILRKDEDADLALLMAGGSGTFTSLDLGDDQNIIETTQVLIVGFPFGKDLAAKEGDNPNISVSTGRVTALRKVKGNLDAIQTDGSVNPGNSGGPLLDDKGRVLGIVQAQVPGAGLNFAVPVSRLKAFLSKPLPLFSPPSIPYEKAADTQDFSIRVLAPLERDRAGLGIDFELSDGPGDRRTFVATRSPDGLFHVRAIPIPRAARPRQLQLTLRNSGTTVICSVEDRPVTVDGRPISLSEIRQISGGTRVSAALVSGQLLSGPIQGIDRVATQIAGEAITLDLARQESVTIRDTTPAAEPVSYKIKIYRGGVTLGEWSGTLPIEGLSSHIPADVLFMSDREGSWAIFSMRSDGSDVRRISHGPVSFAEPVPSPDGRRILCMGFDGNEFDLNNPTPSLGDGNSQVWIMNADGSQASPITTGASRHHPMWSPDGRRIVVQTEGYGSLQIATMHADGTDFELLTHADANVGNPCWSPDGRKIVCLLSGAGGSRLYTMNANGNNAAPLMDDTGDQWGPVWSPDGRRIAYVETHDAVRQLCVVNADGTGRRPLTQESIWLDRPSWSPDGTRLLFVRGGQIYVINADGTGEHRVSDGRSHDGYPCWRVRR